MLHLASRARRVPPHLAAALLTSAAEAGPHVRPGGLAALAAGQRRAISSSPAPARDFGGGYFPPSAGRSPFVDAGALSTVNYGVR